MFYSHSEVQTVLSCLLQKIDRLVVTKNTMIQRSEQYGSLFESSLVVWQLNTMMLSYAVYGLQGCEISSTDTADSVRQIYCGLISLLGASDRICDPTLLSNLLFGMQRLVASECPDIYAALVSEALFVIDANKEILAFRESFLDPLNSDGIADCLFGLQVGYTL